jgi:hypothetical protein
MALPLENLAPVALPGTEKTPGCDCGGPGCVPSWVKEEL